MENREKYYNLFKSNLKVGSVRDLGCALYVIKTKGEDNCPKGIDCKECCLETFELNGFMKNIFLISKKSITKKVHLMAKN